MKIPGMVSISFLRSFEHNKKTALPDWEHGRLLALHSFSRYALTLPIQLVFIHNLFPDIGKQCGYHIPMIFSNRHNLLQPCYPQVFDESW